MLAKIRLDAEEIMCWTHETCVVLQAQNLTRETILSGENGDREIRFSLFS